jgi:hypothetical protein
MVRRALSSCTPNSIYNPMGLTGTNGPIVSPRSSNGRTLPLIREIVFECNTVGVTGTVQSFNNGGVGTHLTGQEYSVCVRYP